MNATAYAPDALLENVLRSPYTGPDEDAGCGSEHEQEERVHDEVRRRCVATRARGLFGPQPDTLSLSPRVLAGTMRQTPYDGPERLVFGIDVGTAMSAVSFVHLRRLDVPEVKLVCRWPGQEEAAGDAKFPTAILYDAGGEPHSFGAAALEAANEEMVLVRWWKLLLHPAAMHKASGITPIPLPGHLTLKQVYQDFIYHIFDHATQFFLETQPNAAATWQRLQHSFELVFAIPNGWTEDEQHFLRDAVLSADILPDDYGDQRLSFVSEAEASVHFALEDMGFGAQLSVGEIFTVLDAGGSTVDTAMYRCTAVYPQLRLQEVTSSECCEAGSVFVDREFEKWLRKRLRNSKYGIDACIATILKIFETKTKRRFRLDDTDILIPFGATFRESDELCGIRKGNLSVPREIMERTFDKAVDTIVASVHRILDRAARSSCKACLLVGGFAESQYLRESLQNALNDRESEDDRMLQFVMSDRPTAKAAAVGACKWRIRHYVTARAARYTFGVSRWEHWEPDKFPKQKERAQHVVCGSDGDLMIPGCLSIMVRKNQIVDRDTPISIPLRWDGRTPSGLGLETWSIELLVSDSEDPGYWADRVKGGLAPGIRKACTLTANLSGMRRALKRYRATSGEDAGELMYWAEYNVEVYFGQTSLKAYITWKEKGKMMKGPVSIVPNSIDR
ncbi:hypothetical protein EXIGLDRAFT_391668 [Exidia glandulosa HHB12029]|uniref:Actin-like ATPase domain-containing protein n=1 Tax=Exidia glandulosa HHB12029 TaxID=1314781 RepID=A0A165BRY2_EXIGL|nr:hypothetical protein EXIGLDRAFT_391668 [Exidia glandulosa HHB12029]